MLRTAMLTPDQIAEAEKAAREPDNEDLQELIREHPAFKPMIDHKTIGKEVVDVCNKHGLTNDQATKVLIYTASKLIAQRFNVPDSEGAEMLSVAARHFRDEILRVDRMFENQG